MLELYFDNNFLNYKNQQFEIQDIICDDDFNVNIHIINEFNNVSMLLQANEVSINGVLQTSVQMIIDTLSNGQS